MYVSGKVKWPGEGWRGVVQAGMECKQMVNVMWLRQKWVWRDMLY